MEQQDFNDKVTKVLDQITDALVSGGETRDALYQMMQLDSSRVDSLEDRIDILMGERSLLNNKKDFEESIENHLEREGSTITPKELLNLGFVERYQEVECGEPGFMYYDFRIHGIDLATNDVGSTSLHVYTEDSHEIHDLRKVKDLIIALNKL